MIIDSILNETNSDVRHTLIQHYLKEGKRTHAAMLPKYLLWREYLLRSDRYKNLSEWVRSTTAHSEIPITDSRVSDPDQQVQDYLTFAVEYDQARKGLLGFPFGLICRALTDMKSGLSKYPGLPSLLRWMMQNGCLESPELITTFSVFGDIHREPEELFVLRVLTILDQRHETIVRDISDVIDSLLWITECFAKDRNSDTLSIDEYKSALKRTLTDSFSLVPYIIAPHRNKDHILELVGKMLDEKRAENDAILKQSSHRPRELRDRGLQPVPEHSKLVSPGGIFEGDFQFVYPTGKVSKDALQRYLRVHDMRKENKTTQQIADVCYADSKSSEDSIARQVKRDIATARQIIANTEQGFFPGDNR